MSSGNMHTYACVSRATCIPYACVPLTACIPLCMSLKPHVYPMHSQPAYPYACLSNPMYAPCMCLTNHMHTPCMCLTNHNAYPMHVQMEWGCDAWWWGWWFTCIGYACRMHDDDVMMTMTRTVMMMTVMVRREDMHVKIEWSGCNVRINPSCVW